MSRLPELRELTRMRVLLFWREPEAVFWVFLFPVVLALVLSFAFQSRGIDPSRVGAVIAGADTAWAAALDAAPDVDLVRFPDRDTAERKLRSGALDALVTAGDSLRVRIDPTRPDGELAQRRVDAVVQRAAGRTDPVLTAVDPVRERGSRYIDFLIPGLLGMNLMGTGMWGTGFAIADMRQKKLLKRLLVTPMRRSSLLAGQMISRLAFLVMEVAVITLFGVLVLGVPFRGSVPAYAVLCLAGALCFSGFGLLVASRVQTIEGVSGLMNFVMMPMWLLSGVFFSYERFPEFLHPFIRLLPLTAINDGLRRLMLEGGGPLSVGAEFLVAAVWTVLTFAVALRIFRWK